jgi:N-acyl-L-homoserine lactone synthetase
MIDLILPEDRFAFADALMQMHHDRKCVFVDRFGWNLAAPGSWLEVDQFDNEHAVYLLSRDALSGRHEASVRLLPSTEPHMLASIFAGLCAAGVPVGLDCWEVSRLVTSPANACGTSILRVHRLLALAMAEFATLNNICRYTLVTEPLRVPALLSVGWAVRPLGLPARHLGQDVQAFEILITPETLPMMRGKFRVTDPILRSRMFDRRAA